MRRTTDPAKQRAPLAPQPTDPAHPESRKETIPVIEEQIEITKRVVDTGSVRFDKTVTEREETLDEPVIHHEVWYERVEVGRLLDEGEVPPIRQEGETIVIPVVEEVLVKRLRLKEEIRISREAREERSHQTVTLRREHVSASSTPRSTPGGTKDKNSTPHARESRTYPGERTMSNVVVGVFETMNKAEEARQELTRSGIPAGEIAIKSQQDADAGTTGVSDRDTEHEGGIMHFFRSLFGMDDDSAHAGIYSEAVRRNNAVLTVNATDDDQADLAQDVMERCGALDIDERTEQWRREGWTPGVAGTTAQQSVRGAGGMYTEGADIHEPTSGDVRATETAADKVRRDMGAAEGRQTFPVMEEELQVGKREVRRGGVRVFSRVTEKDAQETVRLREEHAKVDRRRVDRPASEADMNAAFKEKSVEVRETSEEPVVTKKARVVEEVDVGKEVTQRDETVRDKVRRTDVEVERMDAAREPGSASGDYDEDFRTHWNSNYASAGGRYEDYAPAYSYGSTMATSGRYTGRTWDEIEPEAREDWESHNPGSAWERFKDSVRYGWEKLTGSDDSGAAVRTTRTRGRSGADKRL